MGKKRHSAEEIENKLCQADMELAKGIGVEQVGRQLNIIDKRYYRWRRDYSGLKVDQAKRFKALERENARPAQVHPSR